MDHLEHLKKIVIDPEKLASARGSLPLTRAATAIGISKQRLWNYENGRYAPPSDVIARLCLLYKVPIQSLTNIGEKILEELYISA